MLLIIQRYTCAVWCVPHVKCVINHVKRGYCNAVVFVCMCECVSACVKHVMTSSLRQNVRHEITKFVMT